MAGGSSPGSTSPSSSARQSYQPSTFTSSANSSSAGTIVSTSPPLSHSQQSKKQSTTSYPQYQGVANPLARSQTMAADVAIGSHALGAFSLSTISERKTVGYNSNPANMSNTMTVGLSRLELTSSNPEPKDTYPTILIRKLPRTLSLETLEGMLLFAKELVDVNFVESDQSEDHGYATAVARFRSTGSAQDTKEMLHGKAMAGDAKLMVELHTSGGLGSLVRRNTADGNLVRKNSSSASSSGVGGGLAGRSRFNGTFQGLERLSPPIEAYAGQYDSNAHIQSLFSPQSPLGTNAISGKSMINDDPSDEIGKLVDDPVAFARNGESEAAAAAAAAAHRNNASQMPLARFQGLSLNTINGHANGGHTNMASPPLSGFVSPRSMGQSHTPASALSPNGVGSMTSHGSQSHFGMSSPAYGRFQYPPANPADQNPPCNTLYVGNLPMDTSEDELKALFSKQRGYKRLCFRTKQNGPMCFVEFEDVSFATKALNELYGHPLHNSVKGGIRLSFSKNPLGVRNGQHPGSSMNGGMGPNGMMGLMNGPVSPGNAFAIPGMNGTLPNGIGAPPGFANSMGAPPGLGGPPGMGQGLSPGLSMSVINGDYMSAYPTGAYPIGTRASSIPPIGNPYQGVVGGEYHHSRFANH